MKPVHIKRFRNLIRVLRDAQKSEELRAKFTMALYGYRASTERACGTPACAMGHYAFRTDVQRTFRLARDGWAVDLDGHCFHDAESVFAQHFGIDPTEARRLFGSEGCGDAKTPGQAADFIERWFMQKLKASLPAKFAKSIKDRARGVEV
jgi:hypothetical protein